MQWNCTCFLGLFLYSFIQEASAHTLIGVQSPSWGGARIALGIAGIPLHICPSPDSKNVRIKSFQSVRLWLASLSLHLLTTKIYVKCSKERGIKVRFPRNNSFFSLQTSTHPRDQKRLHVLFPTRSRFLGWTMAWEKVMAKLTFHFISFWFKSPLPLSAGSLLCVPWPNFPYHSLSNSHPNVLVLCPQTPLKLGSPPTLPPLERHHQQASGTRAAC